MIGDSGPLPERHKEILKLVRDQIVYALEEELGGGESIMKEVWEEMETDEEQEAANTELKTLIQMIKIMPL